MQGGSLQERMGWNCFISHIKGEIFSHAKKKLINKMIEALPTDGSEPSVKILRRKAFYFANSGQVDNEGKSTIFGQIFQQLRSQEFKSFKKNRVDNKVFDVRIAGEGA
jgi:hypothetical protein